MRYLDETLPEHRKLLRYVAVAETFAAMSKDPSTRVGAVSLDFNFNIVSAGYNGFPRGVVDSEERYADRPTKMSLVAHAEANLVAQAAHGGRALAGTTVIVTPLAPCSACAKLLVQAGVIRVVCPVPHYEPRWQQEAETAALIFREAGVEVLHLLQA